MRRIRATHNTAADLRERTRRLFARSPLSAFLPLIEQTIQDFTQSTDPSAVRALIRLIEYYERLFANGFGPRFHVDAWFCDDVCSRWSGPQLHLPRPIIPIYGD